jgi:hypothetical protein
MPKNIFIYIALLSFFTLTYACSSKSTGSKPEVLLSEERMIEITTDIQLVEAALNYRRNIGQDYTGTKVDYYAELFKRHGIDQQIYQANVEFYNRNPEQMEKIYDAVLLKLNDLQADIEEEKYED